MAFGFCLRNKRSRFTTSKTSPSQMNWTSLRNNRLKFTTFENYRSFQGKFKKLVKKTMQDEWQFCLGLHLHHGQKPLFILRCNFRCRSRKDWACSNNFGCQHNFHSKFLVHMATTCMPKILNFLVIGAPTLMMGPGGRGGCGH